MVRRARSQQKEKPVESLQRAESHLKEVEERIQNQLKRNKNEKERSNPINYLYRFVVQVGCQMASEGKQILNSQLDRK